MVAGRLGGKVEQRVKIKVQKDREEQNTKSETLNNMKKRSVINSQRSL